MRMLEVPSAASWQSFSGIEFIMLRQSSEIVADCHRRAYEAALKASAATKPADREFWLACEQRWLGLARSYETSERLNEYVQSRPARILEYAKAAEDAKPTADETLRLVNALNLVTDPDKLAELLALAEEMASESPEFQKQQQRRETKH